MKIALILGTNPGQADIIRYLKEKKWKVHACGFQNKGSGVELADSFHLVDIRDKQKVRDLAINIKPDIIYSVSSDFAIRIATQVSAELNLPHLLNPDLIDLFHFKQRLRAFLNHTDLGNVEYKVISSVDDIINWDIFPCIVKPVDSQGQRGLTMVTNREKFKDAVSSGLVHSESNEVIIEEYLDGVEVSTNVIVQDQQVIVNEFTERYVHPLPIIGIPCGHAISPRNVEQSQIKRASTLVEKLVARLNITDAVLYIQFKITKKGPKIIEIAPRLDGCHIWRLIKYARNYDLREYAINCLTGKKINHQKKSENADPYALKFYHSKPGSSFSKKNSLTPEDILFNEFRYEEGETVEPINGTIEVTGYYIKRG